MDFEGESSQIVAPAAVREHTLENRHVGHVDGEILEHDLLDGILPPTGKDGIARYGRWQLIHTEMDDAVEDLLRKLFHGGQTCLWEVENEDENAT